MAVDRFAAAEQILTLHNDSLTTYLHASKTNEQDVRPLVDQRGVHIDGTVRHSAGLPMMLAGNPFSEGWNGNNALGGIRLDTGTLPIHDIDLSLPAPGFSWVIGRSYNSRQKDSGGSYFSSNGFQGKNWFQLSQPEILRYAGTLDVIYLVYGADRFIEFKEVVKGEPEFKAVNGGAGGMFFAAGAGSEPDTYTYTDQHGNTIVFFGFDNDSGVAKGQLWKMTDPSGNVAYVGDQTTGSTAITNGFNGSGWITTAYQNLAASATRRFTYDYTSGKLDSVTVAEKPSGGSYTNTGDKVEYTYYVNADSHGSDGDLKLVKITRQLTDTTVIMKKGYWYYEGSYDADTNPGYTNQIQYIIDFEGYRKLDRLDATDDDDPLSASESDMKPYASAFFKYDTERRIKASWSHGACGCSGGSGTGTTEFAFGSNGSFSGTSGYDTAWKNRTVVKLPDSSYVTQFFDEVGQPLHRVVSNGDPAVTSGRTYWPTQVTRNSSGQLTQIDSPANITAYTHSSSSFTSSTSAGLITVFTRIASGDMTGLVEHIKHKTGSSGSAYLDGTTAYTSATKQLSDNLGVTRPLISSKRVYSEEITSGTTGSYLTSMSYTMHTGDGVLMPKQITTTYPTVSTANNGSNSATTTKQYLRKDGTTAFTESQDSIFNYTQFTNGLLVKSIADAQTNHGSDFASGDDPNTDFGITESSSGLRKITTLAYDAQGRADTTTLPGGMVKKNYYTKLADKRLVILRFNDYEATPKFYGPVGYSVMNHAGKAEVQSTIKLTNNESTSALSAWIDETDADPITAVDVGTVARLSTTVYDKPGNRVDESRMYFLIPASGDGSSGTNYDKTTFGYDDSGRRWRTKQADGTIERSVFDAIGRHSARWIGTNDSSFSGGEPSGTDNMVRTIDVSYDTNGHVTTQYAYVQDDGTDRRSTEFSRDVRGRVLLQTNPNAPHTFNKYDNMGRLIASGQFSSTANIVVGTDDPTTETSNRMALSQTFYDERGQVWKTQRHKIDDADGSDDDNLQALSWFDAAGRPIKQDGEQLTKTFYDRLGRTTHQFILASINDSAYADADDVAGDIVLEEHQTTYDTTEDVVIMSAVIQRLHDDYSTGETTGALDTNADADALMYTATNLEGRIQITVMWYDRFDRKIDEVRYGTNGGSNFDRDGLSQPSRSDTALRTTWVYNEDGSLKSITDPEALETRYTRDDAGRETVVINNYVNGTPSGTTGDDDVHTRYAYTSGHKTKMWVDFDGDNVEDTGDQVTTWTFGVTKGTSAGDSKISSNSLLYKTIYPAQTGGQTEANRRVLFAYNAQNQEIWKKEHDLNVTETDYDTSGRTTHRRLTTLDGDFDNAVLRISTTYDSLGRVQLITQYNNATVGSGSVTDEVKNTYDDWGPISKVEMDRDSAVGASGDYEVSYTYEKAGSGTENGRNTIRRTSMTQLDAKVIDYTYSSTGNLHDDWASRVTQVKDGAVVLAEYRYNGVGSVVGTDLPEPDMFSNRYSSTSGDYPDLDRFNRPIADDWLIDRSTDRDIYDIDIAYDRNSNITSTEDNIFGHGRDVKYTIDDLNRLTKAEEGTLSGGSIANRTRQQIWTLNQTGNWDKNRLDLNGDNDFIDTGGEVDDQRTHNDPNELTDRDLDTDGDTQYDDTHYDLTYNKLGQLTHDGQHYEYIFDGFGRLRRFANISTHQMVEEFWYYGNGFRKTWHYDTDTDGDVDANDKKYHFAYNERWQMLATFRESDSSPKEHFVHHNAGASGLGGSSYIDAIIRREQDANTAWTSASDGTLEQRRYYHQNWRADVIAMSTDTGAQVEGVRFSSYGRVFGMYAGDMNGDGNVDATDNTLYGGLSGYDVRGDMDRDGDNQADDQTALQANYGKNLGWGKLSYSTAAGGNRRGYAGYEFDPVAAWNQFHVRHRVLNADLGRWVSRDPLGYIDSPNLSAYALSAPTSHLDPLGKQAGFVQPSPWRWYYRRGWPLNGQICNFTSHPILVCSNDGCFVLAPGECTSNWTDKGDHWYSPPYWYKCGANDCSPTDANPSDGAPIETNISDIPSLTANDCYDICNRLCVPMPFPFTPNPCLMACVYCCLNPCTYTPAQVPP